jgi:hypothetical protein
MSDRMSLSNREAHPVAFLLEGGFCLTQKRRQVGALQRCPRLCQNAISAIARIESRL